MNLDTIFFKLVEEVKKETSINILEFRRSRKREYVRIRGVMIAIIFDNVATSLISVAELFGFDHTTIISYRKNHRKEMKQDEVYHRLFINLSLPFCTHLKEKEDLATILLAMEKTFKIKQLVNEK